MKKRTICILMIALLLAMLIPAASLALSNAPSSVAYNGYEMNKATARNYVISFGLEKKVGNNDSWPVYSAPALDAVRGANGKASLHTSDDVYTAGWHGAWLLVRYIKNNGGYRVGWVPRTETNPRLLTDRDLKFAYWNVTLAEDCILTDDPLLESDALAYASAGENLIYLACYRYANGREYAYVQGELYGSPICGFIPFDSIAWW